MVFESSNNFGAVRNKSTPLGTGEGLMYPDLEFSNAELSDLYLLYRAASKAETLALRESGYIFTPYEYAMSQKWFATSIQNARKWGSLFYPDEIYEVIEITIPCKALNYMFYVEMLDNIELFSGCVFVK